MKGELEYGTKSNPWYGVLYPNIYDNFELIDFDTIVSIIKAEEEK